MIDADVCVVGAGPAGLTALQVLRERGITAVCFEQGLAVGGQWRYENESGSSSTYASLTMMSSRRPSGLRRFPIQRTARRFPSLADMQEYLEDFAGTYDLFDDIRFGREVVSVTGEPGRFHVRTRDGAPVTVRHVLVASGHHSRPHWPTLPDDFDGACTHSASYRVPAQMAGERVVVVGCGNSALEIAVDVSSDARSTIVAVRTGSHLIPKRLGPMPLDLLDTAALSRVPFRLRQLLLAGLLRAVRESSRHAGLPVPEHGLLRRIPVTAEHFGRRVREGAIQVRAHVVGAHGRVLHFADGSTAETDRLLCATGYDIWHPYLRDVAIDTRARPLYRRIVHPDHPGFFFIGLIDPNGGLLPVLEGQSEWVADVLEGRIEMPTRRDMEREVDLEADRIARRFVPPTGASTWLLCDRWPYLRLLRADRRRSARRRRASSPRALGSLVGRSVG